MPTRLSYLSAHPSRLTLSLSKGEAWRQMPRLHLGSSADGCSTRGTTASQPSYMGGWVYILRCADGAYYVGTTRADLERRVDEHNAGTFDGWTKTRRPVELVFSQSFERIEDTIAAERQLKGWSRAKKEALIRGDLAALVRLSRGREKGGGAPGGPHPSTGSG